MSDVEIPQSNESAGKETWSKGSDARLDVRMIKCPAPLRRSDRTQSFQLLSDESQTEKWFLNGFLSWSRPSDENILHDYNKVKREKGKFYNENWTGFTCNNAYNQNVTDTIRNLFLCLECSHFFSYNSVTAGANIRKSVLSLDEQHMISEGQSYFFNCKVWNISLKGWKDHSCFKSM